MFKTGKVCTTKFGYIVKFVFGLPAIAGQVLWNRVSVLLSILLFVHPSFCLSISFLRMGSLVSFETLHGVRGPYIVMCDSQVFSKNPHQTKMTQNSQNWPKNKVFKNILKENQVIIFAWNWCKTKLMVHWHSAKTACLGTISFSSCGQKCLLDNEISVFFNCQY